MMDLLLKFFSMGGHGFYVWIAYGSVLFFLAAQWLIPWRRWQKYLRAQRNHHE
ncbi:heme exporter protein CcmD [Aquicella lusitana]|jgi:heme exporter protein CcmD|uniref:Heme exporter protein D n=1 Tax=Aquicella lusitana TaxID=254246 RepID=A0A370GAH2_9COXI|nr:heme exporter protein CcmD [Aquicella lusitana]RDI40176.1 heme exporter protein CcmD [Aquicella lusitana]VVC72433.1 hypothetical protein AQULUS_01450 [Aquicella lusitana]